ncbi:hypothetical protein KI372_06465 [Halobacterium salinarum]|uniref:hypothetical protein n=1 Tax=Halobacterium salinarum TaxID=2242 RepID=UPI001F18E50E|nr:hypothetical protein [Halobacterium salinarum]MCF2206363.1 hypothetical protein [Halobacterium salinarum]MCF2241033.1 hypothetical protein [Halobacterium salinarum]
MDAPLRAGIAVYNAGHHRAARDALADGWLARCRDDDAERHCTAALRAFAAAVVAAHDHDPQAVRAHCRHAREQFACCPEDAGVDVEAADAALDALADDPDRVTDAGAPPLVVSGTAITPSALGPPAAVEAAVVLADAAGYQADEFKAGVEYAREELADGDYGAITGLLCDFAADADHRAMIATRLRQHVRRKQRREADVAGLFD